MKVSELIEIEDWEEFISILAKTKWDSDKRCEIIGMRWEHLYQKYRPTDGHIEARKRWDKGRNG